MGQAMAIDYGGKRCGIAVTDDAQIIATGLETVPTAEIWDFLARYFSQHAVQTVVIGDPKDLSGNATDATQAANAFCEKLTGLHPSLEIIRWDERFTSKLAMRSMIEGGMKKKNRRKKENLDLISATLMLQEYLQYR